MKDYFEKKTFEATGQHIHHHCICLISIDRETILKNLSLILDPFKYRQYD